ncbi:MAG TPA: carbon starvation CstA family protein [Phycisphaerae bacterium]|nr:carbon starvation CstA family protein [Phycisphaerae bacterium]HRR86426.1 carbon starvation CstA family protein [Phycisphaerae bacterium]
MIVLAILGVSVVFLLLGGWIYAPIIGRVLGERADRVTPAVAINDGRDYVPTRTPIVFAHHFASIAGAGPIIGPVLALLYGWGPALIWILLGGVFLGAVHDYVVAHIAMREGGKNLTVIARRYVGPAAFLMMLVLLVALLVLVCAAFLDLSATALTSKVPVATLKMQPGETIFREVSWVNDMTGQEEPHAIIGGIASTSVVVITAFSPLIGFLYIKRRWPVWLCSGLAILICAVSVAIGLYLPMAVEPMTWKLLISIYVLFAAGVPVWMFLQSRDFINVHMLYVGIIFLAVALIAAAVRGGGEIAGASAIAMNNWSGGSAKLGPGWPVLFVTIACGAVSGFHSLCAGGTTCKQLEKEKAARHVGYFGMLLESLLAVCVVCALIVGLSMQSYSTYCYPTAGKGNPVLTFAMGVGYTAHIGLGIPIAAGALGAMLLLEGFLVTTLDTAVRLTRYMIEEGWSTLFARYDVFAATASGSPISEAQVGEVAGSGGLSPDKVAAASQARFQVIATHGLLNAVLRCLRLYWVNSGIAVALMLLLAMRGYAAVWPIFGSANQLLAALALIVATVWLMAHRRAVWYTLLPALFMLVTSVWMLVRLLFTSYWPVLTTWPKKPALTVVAIIVLVATVAVVTLALRRWLAERANARGAFPIQP